MANLRLETQNSLSLTWLKEGLGEKKPNELNCSNSNSCQLIAISGFN